MPSLFIFCFCPLHLSVKQQTALLYMCLKENQDVAMETSYDVLPCIKQTEGLKGLRLLEPERTKICIDKNIVQLDLCMK